jgi:anti-sigma factor RsiW
MTICEQLSERMPAVARGTAQWTTEERAHLDGCDECQAEWALLTAARGLGLDVAEALDTHHVTERVLGRLRAEGAWARRRQVGWAMGGLAAAAALVLAVAIGRGRRPETAPPSVVAAEIPLPELDSLQTPELQSLLDALDNPTSGTAQGVDAGELDDLDSHELQRVLDGLEG